jgi:hypothetical protein
MPYSRQRPRIASNGRIAVRLSTSQRDLFIRAPETPKDLAHVLHRAPVRSGKLSVRLTRVSLEALIAAAANSHAPDRKAAHELATLLRYLEGLEDRFAEPEYEDESTASE